MGLYPQHTGHHGAFELLWAFVLNVQHRGKLIPVLGRKAARGEGDIVHQRRVDKAQPLLLPGADQHGTVHFKVVDIHQVLIIVAAPDRVLGGQFIIALHAGKQLERSLDTTGHGRQFLYTFRVQPELAGRLSATLVFYLYLFKLKCAGLQVDVLTCSLPLVRSIKTLLGSKVIC